MLRAPLRSSGAWHCADCDSWHSPGVGVCLCGARRDQTRTADAGDDRRPTPGRRILIRS